MNRAVRTTAHEANPRGPAGSPERGTDRRPTRPWGSASHGAAAGEGGQGPASPTRGFSLRLARLRSDRGSATAEYAVATMAAVGFAGLLVIILRGDEVRAILTDLVRNALTLG